MGRKLVAVDEVSLYIERGGPYTVGRGESAAQNHVCRCPSYISRTRATSCSTDILYGQKGYNPMQFRQDVQPIIQNP
jgi:hypothetical protein